MHRWLGIRLIKYGFLVCNGFTPGNNTNSVRSSLNDRLLMFVAVVGCYPLLHVCFQFLKRNPAVTECKECALILGQALNKHSTTVIRPVQ